MSPADREQAVVEPAERADLARSFVLILLVEFAVILALFAFGRYFAQP